MLYLSVSVSVTSRCSVKAVEQIGLVLAWELPPTYLTLCCKKIQVPSMIIIAVSLYLVGPYRLQYILPLTCGPSTALGMSCVFVFAMSSVVQNDL